MIVDLTITNRTTQQINITVVDKDTKLPVNNAAVRITLTKYDGNKPLDDVSADYVALSAGVYRYTIPSTFDEEPRSDYKLVATEIDGAIQTPKTFKVEVVNP